MVVEPLTWRGTHTATWGVSIELSCLFGGSRFIYRNNLNALIVSIVNKIHY